MSDDLPIVFTAHARERMEDRGATEEEVVDAIRNGADEPARKGRVRYSKGFPFGARWRDQVYQNKQVAPIVARETDRLLVVTVYTFYY